MNGISHSWNGTVLTITSDSGTSSCDLKGEKGDDGVRGAQGIQGEQGIQGIQGEQGEKGDKGDTSELAVDNTLTITGQAADAKTTGDKINNINNTVALIETDITVMDSNISEINESIIDINSNIEALQPIGQCVSGSAKPVTSGAAYNLQSQITENTNDIAELNTNLNVTGSNPLLINGASVGNIYKYGRVVQLTLNNVTAKGASGDTLFTLNSTYFPVSQVDFKDTYSNVRIQISMSGKVLLSTELSTGVPIRGTFTYISAS